MTLDVDDTQIVADKEQAALSYQMVPGFMATVKTHRVLHMSGD